MVVGSLDTTTMASTTMASEASVVSAPTSPRLSSTKLSLTSFVRILARGHPVTLVKELPHDPFVDRTPATLRLMSGMNALEIWGDGIFIGTALTYIVDVFTVEAGEREHFPQRLVDRLGPSEAARLLRVVHRISDGTMMEFCMLDAHPSLLLKTLTALIKRAGKGAASQPSARRRSPGRRSEKARPAAAPAGGRADALGGRGRARSEGE